MFGIGSTELLVILVVALIVLGPKSLAKVSRTLGKAMGEFRRVSTDFQRTLNAEAAEDDRRERREAAARAAQAAKESRAAARGGADAPPLASEAASAETTPESALHAYDAQAAEETQAHPVAPPAGSPLEAALAKTRAAAEAASGANHAAMSAAASGTPDKGDKA